MRGWWVLTILRDDFRFSNTAVSQKLAKGLRSNDPFPRIEGRMEIGAKQLYGLPPCGGTRLEHARSPGGDSELPARPYHTPQFPDLGGGGRSPTNLDLCLCALERLNKGHHPPALVRIGQAAAHGGEIVCHVRRIGGAGNNGRDPLVGE
jgi:hypothetical protein